MRDDTHSLFPTLTWCPLRVIDEKDFSGLTLKSYELAHACSLLEFSRFRVYKFVGPASKVWEVGEVNSAWVRLFQVLK